MVGTLRAASENDKQNGRSTQRPYIAERKQIQDEEPKVDVSQVGLKRKTEIHRTKHGRDTAAVSEKQEQSGEGMMQNGKQKGEHAPLMTLKPLRTLRTLKTLNTLNTLNTLKSF